MRDERFGQIFRVIRYLGWRFFSNLINKILAKTGLCKNRDRSPIFDPLGTEGSEEEG